MLCPSFRPSSIRLRSGALALALSLALMFLGSATAARAEESLSSEVRTRIIEAVAARIAQAYVLPEMAAQMEAALRSRAAAHEYDAVKSIGELCSRLTQDLQQVSSDLHLEIMYRKAPVAPGGKLNGAGRTPAEQQQAGRLSNFGFETVSRMAGNIGYLDLREFYSVESGYATAEAAMAFLRHTDALIIDLRDNPGGVLEMNVLLSTYLLGRKLIHLNSLRGRDPGLVGELWTVPQATKITYAGAVYLLTNRQTFSQAEAFAYQLQQLKRATVVGERTAGGAHLVAFEPITDGVVLRLPTGRFVHPVTQTNWQGVGVSPEVEVAGEEALARAYLLALTALQRKNKNPELSPVYDTLVDRAQRSSMKPGNAPR